MESNNKLAGVTPEQQVQSLLKRAKSERLGNDYSNVPLKDVPFAVLWNTFSRSNWKLPQ